MAIDPPAVNRDPQLTQRLEQAYAEKGADYTPRTQLLDDDGRLVRRERPRHPALVHLGCWVNVQHYLHRECACSLLLGYDAWVADPLLEVIDKSD